MTKRYYVCLVLLLAMKIILCVTLIFLLNLNLLSVNVLKLETAN